MELNVQSVTSKGGPVVKMIIIQVQSLFFPLFVLDELLLLLLIRALINFDVYLEFDLITRKRVIRDFAYFT